MTDVVLSIPRLGVKRGGWEKNKEVYVLSFASDENLQRPKLPDVIASHNETLPNVVPEVAKQALMDYVLVAVSNTFQRIRPDQPLSLSGSGILLYPNLDPGGMLVSHFVVMEDDQDQRNLGGLLAQLFKNKDVRGLTTSLQGRFSRPLVAQLFNVLVSNLPTILGKDRDDFLFAHSHSGFDFDDYGLPPGETLGHDFELENDRVFCTLRLRVNQG